MNTSQSIAQQLAYRIFAQEYPPHSRLPTELDLIREMTSNKVIVREAIRSLVNQGLVSVKRGSGSTVLAPESWNASVMTAYLQYCLQNLHFDEFQAQITNVMSLRTAIVVRGVAQAALASGSINAVVANELVQLTWDARESIGDFTQYEIDFFNYIFSQSNQMALVWTINSQRGIVAAFADQIPATSLTIESNYRETMGELITAVCDGNSDQARKIIDRYFEQRDRSIDYVFKVLRRG